VFENRKRGLGFGKRVFSFYVERRRGPYERRKILEKKKKKGSVSAYEEGGATKSER